MNSSDNSLQLCHTVDKDRSIGWHQVNKRTQRSRYAALSCLSAISCAVDTVSALPSSSFRRVSSSATIGQSFNLQRSPRGFFLSVLSGPRVGQSTRIIALRARARSDTCRDHRPPSCTLGQRSTTLSFHRFSKRNPPIIPHVICPTLTATKSCTWNNTNRRCSNDQQPGCTRLQNSNPFDSAAPLIALFSSVAARTRLPLSFSLPLFPSLSTSFDTIGRTPGTTRIFTIGVSFLLFPLFLSLLYTRSENKGTRIGSRVVIESLLLYRGRRNDWRVFHPRPACV